MSNVRIGAVSERHAGVGAWAPPLGGFLMRFTLTALTLIYTGRYSSLRRICAIAITSLSVLQLLVVSSFPVSVLCASVSIIDCFVLTIHQLNLLVVTKLENDDLQFGKRTAPAGNFVRDLCGALYLMTSTRGLHTRWQAKNTPMWPRFYDGQYWSRAFFIQRQTAIAIWQGLMLAFLCAVWQRHSSFLMASFISCPETLHQTGMRAILSLSMWLLFARLIGDFNYRIVSIISTALKTSDFQDWPPLFNSMLEAWTLRRFWGTFWHQCLRWPFCSAATVITRKGLGLQRPSLLERYTHILCVFVISGTLHTLCDLAFGIRWHESGALLFFSSFALGIMVEDGVQAVWRRITTAGTRSGNGLENKRKRKMHGGEVTPTWQKEVGFAWVTLWFTITTPSYLGKNWQALIADIDDVDLPFISDLYSWTLVLSLLVGAGFLRWRFGANV